MSPTSPVRETNRNLRFFSIKVAGFYTSGLKFEEVQIGELALLVPEIRIPPRRTDEVLVHPGDISRCHAAPRLRAASRHVEPVDLARNRAFSDEEERLAVVADLRRCRI